MLFTHWFNYFYVPASGPWYAGNVWGNVFVVAVLAPLGYLWSKTKYWPLGPIKKGVTSIHIHLLNHIEESRQHREWSAKHLAEIYEKHMKTPADKHPHFDIGKER
jgi:hypothetical protein